jgi:hypothetical protein
VQDYALRLSAAVRCDTQRLPGVLASVRNRQGEQRAIMLHSNSCSARKRPTDGNRRQFKNYLISLMVMVDAQGIEPWTSPV